VLISMKKIIQKMIDFIDSGQVTAELMPLAHYSLSFLKMLSHADEINYKNYPFKVYDLIDTYQVRECHLRINNIKHGGFLETISSLKQIKSSMVNMLSVEVNGYYFVFLLELETETIVGILYVKQWTTEVGASVGRKGENQEVVGIYI